MKKLFLCMLLATAFVTKSMAQSEQYIGEIRMFAGNFAPSGWALCDGQILSINSNTALFTIIGTTYGGDGRVTFALPDLRGRVPLGAGSGPGLAPRTWGEKGGSENVTLQSNQIPSHTHSMNVTNGAADVTTPSTSTTLAIGKQSATPVKIYKSGQSANQQLHQSTIGYTGGNQSHDNMMPYQTVNYIIALQGIYPPRQ